MTEKRRPGLNIKMTSYDELCGITETGTEGATEMEISRLQDFPNHPFKVRDDDQMKELVTSIKQRGIINALIVMPNDFGDYWIISGHRRKHAAELLGMDKVPVIVADVDENEGTIMMVDSNIQREYICPGDKARAMKQKYDSMIHRGEASEKWSSEEVGEAYGISPRQVHRYMRLTELIDEILEEVDNKRIQLVTAVDISYLEKDVQRWIYEEYANGATIRPDYIKKLRAMAENKVITEADVDDVFHSGTKVKGRELTIGEAKLNSYFTADYSVNDMKEVIYRLLDEWKKQQEGGEE